MLEIVYHPHVSKDIAKIEKPLRARIRIAIEEKLSSKPNLYGIRLRGELREYWKLRVGDYRIVYAIQKSRVYILLIAHRKEVYERAQDRG